MRRWLLVLLLVPSCEDGGSAGERDAGSPDAGVIITCSEGQLAYHDGDYCPPDPYPGLCRTIAPSCADAEDPVTCTVQAWCDACFATWKDDPEVSCALQSGVVQCCHSIPEFPDGG